MGNGRAEQGKDAIAQGLRDIAVIAMHGVHHQLQSGINNRSGFFRIEPFDQRRRAFEIGKQRGDRFALALRQGCGTDALGQMRGRVGSWGLGIRCWGLVLRLATLDLRRPRERRDHTHRRTWR